jgi:hypothetical protein
LKQRKLFKKGFENVDKTKEYCERNYYNVISNDTNLVCLNEVWIQLGKHILEKKTL